MKLCSIDGCDRQSRTRGWCQAHYGRWRRFGDPNHPVQKTSRQPRLCSRQGCGKVHEGHGLCAMHLWRKRRGWSDLDSPPEPVKQPGPVVDDVPAVCVDCDGPPDMGMVRCWPCAEVDLRRRRDGRRQKSYGPDPARDCVKQARWVA